VDEALLQLVLDFSSERPRLSVTGMVVEGTAGELLRLMRSLSAAGFLAVAVELSRLRGVDRIGLEALRSGPDLGLDVAVENAPPHVHVDGRAGPPSP
jgi:hypothetical protein